MPPLKYFAPGAQPKRGPNTVSFTKVRYAQAKQAVKKKAGAPRVLSRATAKPAKGRTQELRRLTTAKPAKGKTQEIRSLTKRVKTVKPVADQPGIVDVEKIAGAAPTLARTQMQELRPKHELVADQVRKLKKRRGGTYSARMLSQGMAK